MNFSFCTNKIQYWIKLFSSFLDWNVCGWRCSRCLSIKSLICHFFVKKCWEISALTQKANSQRVGPVPETLMKERKLQLMFQLLLLTTRGLQRFSNSSCTQCACDHFTKYISLESVFTLLRSWVFSCLCSEIVARETKSQRGPQD